MEERIRSLDDETAIRILKTIAQHNMDEGATETDLPAEKREALSQACGVEVGDVEVSDGEMAREALVLLSREPEMGEAIAAMVENPADQRFAFDPLTAIGLTAAILFVLGSRIEFKINDKGEWSLHFLREPSSDSLLNKFVDKLLSWIPGGPFRKEQ